MTNYTRPLSKSEAIEYVEDWLKEHNQGYVINDDGDVMIANESAELKNFIEEVRALEQDEYVIYLTEASQSYDYDDYVYYQLELNALKTPQIYYKDGGGASLNEFTEAVEALNDY